MRLPTNPADLFTIGLLIGVPLFFLGLVVAALVRRADEALGQRRAASDLRWYHRASLVACSIFMLAMGALNIATGASSGSRFYKVDNVVTRIVGVAMILSAVGLFSRRRWAFGSAISLLAVSILEIVVFPTPELFSSLSNTTVTILTTLLLYGAPIAVVVWLRIAFVKRGDHPSEADEPVS